MREERAIAFDVDLRSNVCWFIRWIFRRPKRAGTLGMVFGPATPKERRPTHMASILTDEQKISISVKPKTLAGNPAQVDGAPVWSNSNPEVIDLVVAPDGMSAEAITVGPIGVSQIVCKADADIGEGVTEIKAIGDIEVVSAMAATVGFEFGAPQIK